MLTARTAVSQALRDARQAAVLLELALRGDGDGTTVSAAALHLRLAAYQIAELFAGCAAATVQAALERPA